MRIWNSHLILLMNTIGHLKLAAATSLVGSSVWYGGFGEHQKNHVMRPHRVGPLEVAGAGMGALKP